MQIGTTELIIILIILMAFGLFRAGLASSGRSPFYRERPQAKDGRADDTDTESEWGKATAPGTAGGKNPYVVLNVPTSATQDEVNTAYRRMAQMYHPDKVAGLAPEYQEIAESKMKDINAAYEQLSRKFKAEGASRR